MVARHVEEMQKRNDELNEKLSPGAYAIKQVRVSVDNAIGAVGGGIAGWYAGGSIKPGSFKPTAEMVESFSKAGSIPKAMVRNPGRTIGAAIGYAVGSTVALLILGYEHWAKGEAQRLAVDEINRDISESKLRMDPELLRENTALREIVAKQDDELKQHSGKGRAHLQAEHETHGKVKERPSHHVSMKDAEHHAPEHDRELAVG